EAALRRRELISTRRQFGELVHAVAIRRGQAVLAELRRDGAHLGFSERLPRVGGQDAAANAGRADLWLNVARRGRWKSRCTGELSRRRNLRGRRRGNEKNAHEQ